ncbi:MAG: lysophospholipid acyltransferase family protein [Porticoccaceae bacterium]
MNLRRRLDYLWRLFATALSFAVFGLGGVLVPLLAMPILRLMPGSVTVRRRRARRLVHWLFRGFILMMRGLGVLSWHIDGGEKLGRPGLLVLANHPTLIDVVFLVAFLPDAVCVVNGRLLANPVMRGFITLTGYIPNDRSGNLLEAAAAALGAGNALVIFPEGTRTRVGEPLRFQRGAANVAVRCRVNATPVVITCSPPTLSKQHRWYHIPERPFALSFTVKDDIDIAPFLNCPAPLGSRRLTTNLEHFFTKECQAHGH